LAIYLDNAATSYPKPPDVSRAMKKFMDEVGSSSGRGAYRKALEADGLVFNTRKALVKLFNIKDPSRICFTSNVTEALNLAIYGLLSKGDRVITSGLEHNSVWRPLCRMREERNIDLVKIECDPNGDLDFDSYLNEIKLGAKLVVMLHASNVIGTILPISEIGKVAHEHEAIFLVDSAQTAGVLPIDVEKDNIDMLAFTGHKGLMGPMGTGGLYIREGIDLRPLIEGGTGGQSILERQPEELPERFEAGTLNVPGIMGLGLAVDFILNESVTKIWKHEKKLTHQLLKGLEEIANVKVYGPRDVEKIVGVISINIEGVEPQEVGYVLDEVYGIMVRTGLHCSPLAHKTIGTIDCGTLRISPGYFNTDQDIANLLVALKEISGESAMVGD
jgi:cysteine desulfurase family protein